jgi:hypothetical protein
MKRTREEEEKEEMVLVDHITDTLPREMVGEVFHAMHVEIEKRGDWYLNSVGAVSRLLYESIKQVASGLFQQLVKQTRDDMEAWSGYVVGRPLSVHERFDQSTLGHMGVSFPWCVLHFYRPPPDLKTTKETLAGVRDDAIRHFTNVGYMSASPYSRECINTFIQWCTGALTTFIDATDVDLFEDPADSWANLYCYMRYAPLPAIMTTLLFQVGYHALARFRNDFVDIIVQHWLSHSLYDRAVFMEWLVYFHGRKFILPVDARHLFVNGMLYHLLGFPFGGEFQPAIPKLRMDNEELFNTFLVADYVKDVTIHFQPNKKIRTDIGSLMFKQEEATLTHWKDTFYDETSIVPQHLQWAGYILRALCGTIQHFARLVLHRLPLLTHANNRTWQHLANLPARPGDPLPSHKLEKLFQSH